MPVIADRVKDVTTTIGTGAVTLAGTPPTGFRAFGAVIPSGSVVPYCIQDSYGNWEVGKGVLSSPTDPYGGYVVALQHFDAAPGSTNNTLLDSSPNNYTLTATGVSQGGAGPYAGMYSMYFDELYSMCTLPTTFPNLGSSDFTVECWYRGTYSAQTQIILSLGENTAAYAALLFAVDATGHFAVYLSQTGSTWLANDLIGTGGVLTVGTWYHLAISRVGGTVTAYVNGVSILTVAVTGSLMTSTTHKVGTYGPTNAVSTKLIADISNLRVVIGSSVYTGNFAPPTQALAAVTNTQLLMLGNNATVKDPAGIAAWGFSGTATVSSTQSRFGGTSLACLGAGGAFFSGNSLILGAADHTVELWVYQVANNTGFLSGTYFQHVIGQAVLGQALSINCWQVTTNSGVPGVALVMGGVVYSASAVSALALNTWTHLAFTRQGTNLRLFVNGVLVATTAIPATAVDLARSISNGIGGDGWGQGFFNGYIDDVRITAGLARYTATFSVPVAPFASANGGLLADPYFSSVTNMLRLDGTNGSTTITDSSAAPITMTNSGVTLNTTTFKYGASSAFFSGASTYILGDGSAAFAFGSGDWTVEFWVNANSYATDMGLYIDQTNSGNDTTRKSIYFQISTAKFIYVTGTTTQIQGTTTPVAGLWYHLAVSRAAGVTRMFINGVQEGISWTDSIVYTVGAARPIIGNDSPGTAVKSLAGYMDEVRITKGVGRYTTNFTPAQCAYATAGTSQLSRDAVRSSSNGNTLVSFGTGSKDVFLTANAELLDNANFGVQYAMSRGMAMP